MELGKGTFPKIVAEEEKQIRWGFKKVKHHFTDL